MSAILVVWLNPHDRMTEGGIELIHHTTFLTLLARSVVTRR